jgi:alkanesulfonate monooxygenase SsuD/methylene tetrahydromethanopterin reductase-like flavin-dependent oxidoreductase (luciferase family)
VALDVGIEVPSTDLAALLGTGLGELPGLLDASGASYVVIGADRAKEADSLSASPTVVGTLLARRTDGIGIVVAASPQRDHPYNVARRAASLDHISGGRGGLLALRRDRSLDLGIGEYSAWAPGDLGTAQLADALIASRKLWRTWPIESLDADPAVARSTQVSYAGHVGVFSTKGPLNVPTTPQGEPVVFWCASPAGPAIEDEIETAVTVADVVLVDYDGLASLEPARLTSILAASAAAGRPAQLHVRVLSAATDAAEAVAALAATSYVDGVVLRASSAALPSLIGEVLPQLAASATVARRAPGARRTLRDLLSIPRRAEPDLSGLIAWGLPRRRRPPRSRRARWG